MLQMNVSHAGMLATLECCQCLNVGHQWQFGPTPKCFQCHYHLGVGPHYQ